MRSAPTTSVASRAERTEWPIASVTEMCSVSRSSEKSNVSPPTCPAGSSQPGQRELIRLACVGRGKQAALDLGRERQWDGPLAPLEEVGVAPVGDDHVGELMGRQLDVLERGRSGLERQDQLEDADRLAAARHRRDDATAITLPQHDRALRGECVAVGRTVQRHATAVSSLREPGSPFASTWPRRFSDRPLKSAIRKLTPRAPSISCIAVAIASTTPIGAAASARVEQGTQIEPARAAPSRAAYRSRRLGRQCPFGQ